MIKYDRLQAKLAISDYAKRRRAGVRKPPGGEAPLPVRAAARLPKTAPVGRFDLLIALCSAR